MTDNELIARQAKRIEILQDEVAAMKKRALDAVSQITGIGGPLNDNKLEFTFDQRNVFHRIVNCLGYYDESTEE